MPLRGAMGKEQFAMAACATAADVDGLGIQARVEQLAPVGLNQVHMQAGADIGVAGRALG